MPSSPRPSAPRPAAVLRASSLEDLASLVPHLLGFVPRESLVVGYLSGRPLRLGLTARFDLPAADELDGPRVVAQRAAELAAQVGAHAAFLLVHTDSPPPAGSHSAALPAARLVADVERRLRGRRVDVLGPGLVSGDRLWHYGGSGAVVARILSPQPSSPALALATEDALAGRRLLDSREELAASVAAHDRVTDEAFAAHLERARVETDRRLATGGWREVALGTRQRVVAAALAAAAGGPPFDVEAAAEVLAALAEPRVRDAVLTLALDALPPGIDDDAEGTGSAEGEGTGAEGSTGGGTPGLFPATGIDAAALLAACVDLASWSRGDTTAAGCSVLAGIAYVLHRGPLAGVAVERALEADPDYPLATLLLATIESALHPSRLRATLRHVRDDLALPPAAQAAA